ncbi:MAG TPA: carboxypeptidase regulatory-like domain-containing protein [Bacillota bacterium]|nr:carboxypeptidase regulatory-like domain-containing protein [Bacillota bacterium]
MKNLSKLFFYCLILLLVSAVIIGCGGGGSSTNSGTGTLSVTGTVKEAGTNVALAGVKISLGSSSTTTDGNGVFSINNVAVGSYTVKAELRGYQSSEQSVNIQNSQALELQLATNGPVVNSSSIELLNGSNAIADGAQIEATKITVAGNINNLVAPRTNMNRLRQADTGTSLTVAQLQVLVNGTITEIGVEPDGDYQQNVPLDPGSNTIQLRVFDNNGAAGSSQVLRIQAVIPRLDIRVVMNWDVDKTDVDLHMFKRNANEPNPAAPSDYQEWLDSLGDNDTRHVCYYNKLGLDFGTSTIQQAFLDIDDTWGYGPETIVLQEATEGRYHIWIHNFDGYSVTNTVPESHVTIKIILNGGTPQARIFTYEKTLTYDWEYSYICSIDWPSGTIVNQPPATSNLTARKLSMPRPMKSKYKKK